MNVASLRDMFEYQLQEMYYVETRLVDVLEELREDANDEKLEKGFDDHRRETQKHVERLERVFDILGTEPQTRESRVLEALVEDREEFRDATDNDELLDLFDMQAAMKNERMEITGYQGLIMLADKLRLEDDVDDLLEDNLSEEKSTLRELEGLSKGSKLKSMIGQLMG